MIRTTPIPRLLAHQRVEVESTPSGMRCVAIDDRSGRAVEAPPLLAAVADLLDGRTDLEDLYARLRAEGFGGTIVDLATLAGWLDEHEMLEPIDLAALPYRFQRGARFACQGCGQCCRLFQLGPIEPAAIARLEGRTWPAHLLVREPFHYRAKPARILKESDFLAREGGGCVFLDHDHLCGVHRHLGAELKPALCHLFPHDGRLFPGEVRVTYRYLCPNMHYSRAEGVGRPIDDDPEALKRNLAAIVPLVSFPVNPIFSFWRGLAFAVEGEAAVTLEAFDRLIERALEAAFEAPTLLEGLARARAAVLACAAGGVLKDGPEVDARIAAADPSPAGDAEAFRFARRRALEICREALRDVWNLDEKLREHRRFATDTLGTVEALIDPARMPEEARALHAAAAWDGEALGGLARDVLRANLWSGRFMDCGDCVLQAFGFVLVATFLVRWHAARYAAREGAPAITGRHLNEAYVGWHVNASVMSYTGGAGRHLTDMARHWDGRSDPLQPAPPG